MRDEKVGSKQVNREDDEQVHCGDKNQAEGKEEKKFEPIMEKNETVVSDEFGEKEDCPIHFNFQPDPEEDQGFPEENQAVGIDDFAKKVDWAIENKFKPIVEENEAVGSHLNEKKVNQVDDEE